jgi:predicted transcriptional regulator of viral defense system
MKKVFPHINQGIGYVQISKLPFNQSIKFRSWISRNSLVNVSTGARTIEDCVQYSEYEYWFDVFGKELKKEYDFGF